MYSYRGGMSSPVYRQKSIIKGDLERILAARLKGIPDRKDSGSTRSGIYSKVRL